MPELIGGFVVQGVICAAINNNQTNQISLKIIYDFIYDDAINVIFDVPNQFMTRSNLIVDLIQPDLLNPRPLQSIHGVIGLIELQGSTYLVVITQSIKINSDYLKISRVHFYSLNSHSNDLIDTPELDFDYHYCLDLKRLIEFGNFYYSPTTDITNNSINSGNPPNDHFIWNSFLVDPLLQWKSSLQLPQRSLIDSLNPFTIIIQGAISIYPLPNSNSSLQLISRLSSKRAGTRFYSRGVDDDGQVANFVESETIFIHNNLTFTYTQIRGSIPLFWEQQGLQAFGQRIQITRPYRASQPAFEKHFYNLLQSYDAIHVLNLLGQKDHEVTLSDSYNTHLDSLQNVNLPITYSNLDFHTVLRLAGHQAVVQKLDQHLSQGQGQGPTWSLIDNTTGQTIIKQHVVFRVNCLDCLDRTNFVQDIFSKSRLGDYLTSTGSAYAHDEGFWQAHRHLWAENGDALSRLYAGTGALNSSYTRTGKRTLAGLFSDATKSVTRAYVSNVTDKAKQTSIDMFLGNLPTQRGVSVYDPVSDLVNGALGERLGEYSTSHPISIHTGTYNVAGQIPTEDILPWILPDLPGQADADMLVLAFQELVQLTPQQIMSTDTFPLAVWERFILETLRSRGDEGESKYARDDYIILRSEQIVGLALIVLVKAPLAPRVRSVEGVLKKTGLKGMSGNKGAAAIRLQYESTTFCFIAAHMAAGQAGVEERNNDYRTIAAGLSFQQGKVPSSHDCVIWLGDFNYRVDLPYDVATQLAYDGDFHYLLKHDQLSRAMRSGIFKGFTEMDIHFAPTYRFDFGSDVYDTSEKRRVPAYTDRVLYKCRNDAGGGDADMLQGQAYDSVPLKGSDHRPVYARFSAVVRVIDGDKRDAIAKQVQNDANRSIVTEEGVDEKLARLGLKGRNMNRSLSVDLNGGLTPNDDLLPPSSLPSPSTEVDNWWTDELGNDIDFVSHLYPDGKEDDIAVPSAQKIRRPPPPPPARLDVDVDEKDDTAVDDVEDVDDAELIRLNKNKENTGTPSPRKPSVTEMIGKIEGSNSDVKEEREEAGDSSDTLKDAHANSQNTKPRKPRPPVPKATKPRVLSNDEEIKAE
ncbi:hypothetical protein E3P95_02487 [Wallemia ichthyophaga]|nr:hypothetical protein E3P95_02487 [Wallemia ichthyophaga]